MCEHLLYFTTFLLNTHEGPGSWFRAESQVHKIAAVPYSHRNKPWSVALAPGD